MVAATTPKTGKATGKIVQVLGPVVDIQFPPDELPEIYNAVEVEMDSGITLVLEVQSHLGNDWVRAVAMSSTDGVRRGMDVVDTGLAIAVPVGPEALGRILNVVGEPIDQAGPVEAARTSPDSPPGPDVRRAVDAG